MKKMYIILFLVVLAGVFIVYRQSTPKKFGPAIASYNLSVLGKTTLPKVFERNSIYLSSSYYAPELFEALGHSEQDRPGLISFYFYTDKHTNPGGSVYLTNLGVTFYKDDTSLADFSNYSKFGTLHVETPKIINEGFTISELGNGYKVLLFRDSQKHSILELAYDGKKYAETETRALLKTVNDKTTTDANQVQNFFRRSDLFWNNPKLFQKDSLKTLNDYLQANNLPAVQIGGVAAKDGMAYAVFDRVSSKKDSSSLTLYAAKHLGVLSEADLTKMSKDQRGYLFRNNYFNAGYLKSDANISLEEKNQLFTKLSPNPNTADTNNYYCLWGVNLSDTLDFNALFKTVGDAKLEFK